MEIHDLSSREFEVLAANYAQSIFPEYEWWLTAAVADYNRDFEALFEEMSKWGEAKQTQKEDKSVTKGRWDPTLLSALLKNNVDELILVTSGWTPLEYVVRACHMAERSKSVNKIIFINGYIINEWLKANNKCFNNFNVKNLDLNKKSIKPIDYDNKYKEECIIQAFDMYNILEPQYELKDKVPYKILITFFITANRTIKLTLPKCFKANSILWRNLSDKFQKVNTLYEIKNEVQFEAGMGYIQIEISGSGISGQGIFKDKITVSKNNKIFKNQEIIVKNSPDTDSLNNSQMARIGNEWDRCLCTQTNTVVKVTDISRNDITHISDSNEHFFYFKFSSSYCENAMELCKLMSLEYFGIYNDDGESKTVQKAVNSTLNYCPIYQSNILIGATDYVYAVNVLKEMLKNKKGYLSENYLIPEMSTVFIEVSKSIDDGFLKLLDAHLAFFCMQKNKSMIVLSQNTVSEPKPACNNSDMTSEIQILDNIRTGNSINGYLKKIRKMACMYYNETDFFRAKFFYDLLFQNDSTIEHDVYEICNYADTLNHCGSMIKSREMFEMAAKSDIANDTQKEKKVLEAKTEIFNLRFWILDVNTLVDDIDHLLQNYSGILKSDTGGTRDLYAYYNCLNRKMVTQYLIGDYKNAEITFKSYINSIDSGNYINYKAFAYMDSARGLYAHKLSTAKYRLSKSMSILKELVKNNREYRRFYDCNVELEYVTFISKYEAGIDPDIKPLETAVTQVRFKGYTNMLLKCNLKLAACYLALGNTSACKKCLNYVKESCDFYENPRVELMYNNLFSAYLSIISLNAAQKYGIAPVNKDKHYITFANSSEKIYIDPRLW